MSCTACGHTNSESAKFCPECGTPVAVRCASCGGELLPAEQLDPEQWHKIVERFFEILTEGVHRFEGTVNQYTGDGITLFGAPIADEDHAQRACYAALHLRTERLDREWELS